MKILVVSNMYPNKKSPYWGTFVRECVDGYRHAGVEVEKTVIRESSLIGYFSFYLKVFIKILLGNYDIVHVHYVTHSITPVLIVRLLKKFKIVLNFHGSDAFPEKKEKNYKVKLKDIVCKIAIKHADLTIVPSSYFKEKLRLKYELKKVFISPSGGVDTQIFKFNSLGGKSVLYAGRMIPEKGALTAANAVLKCRNDIENATFVGDGPDKEYLITNLKDIEVTHYNLLGQKELAEMMAQSDIFLFPSIREGESLGLVIIESILSGMIPLVIKNGAVEEIIPEQYHNLLIAKDSNCFINKLEHLLSLRAEERLDISKKLFDHAISRFENKIVAQNLVNRLNLLLR